MDRELSKKTIRKRNIKTISKISFSILVLISIAWILTSALTSKLRITDLDISIVDKGTIETTISSTGKVIPIKEIILSSTLNGKIKDIIKQRGDQINANDTILIIDNTKYLKKLTKILDEIKIENNKIKQFTLNSKDDYENNRSQLKIDSIKIGAVKSELNQEKYLLSIGGSNQEKVNKIENNYKALLIKHKLLKNKIKNSKVRNKLTLEAKQIEFAIKNRMAKELKNKIEKAYLKSTTSGIITQLNLKIGETVSENQVLIKLANLNHFKIRSKITSENANRVFLNQEAKVKIDQTTIRGKVTNISPNIESGFIYFEIKLKDDSNPKLRSNASIETGIITHKFENTLRINNKDFYNGPGLYNLFVLNNKKLIQKSVELGRCSFHKVRVISGLKEGDKIITRKEIYNKYKDYKELAIE